MKGQKWSAHCQTRFFPLVVWPEATIFLIDIQKKPIEHKDSNMHDWNAWLNFHDKLRCGVCVTNIVNVFGMSDFERWIGESHKENWKKKNEQKKKSPISLLINESQNRENSKQYLIIMRINNADVR